MLPHRIRLRGPWELTPLKRVDGSETNWPPFTAPMPARWRECGLTGFSGKVRHTRRFGMPRQIDSFERVWLTLDGISGHSEIWLNDERLGEWPNGSTPFDVEITRRLRERNELRVEIDADESGGMPGEAALEIRGQAWLDGLKARLIDGRLSVRGRVNGQADGPLDLYAIMGRSCVLQKRIETSSLGNSFEFDTGAPPTENLESVVRIELVSGSQVLHAELVPVESE